MVKVKRVESCLVQSSIRPRESIGGDLKERFIYIFDRAEAVQECRKTGSRLPRSLSEVKELVKGKFGLQKHLRDPVWVRF